MGRDSGGTEKDAPNAFLEAELDSAALRGALNTNNVFTAICAGYLEGTEPYICKKCMNCSDKQACVENGKCPAGSSTTSGVPFHTYVISMVIIATAIGLVAFVYYRKSQEQMREQVRGILAEYMPLEDHDVDSPAVAFAKLGGPHQIS